MRDWLFKTKLFSWAYRQGGIDSFALAQKDILDTMADDLEERAAVLAKEKLATLLSVVDDKMIVKLDTRNGVVFIGDERPDDGRLEPVQARSGW